MSIRTAGITLCTAAMLAGCTAAQQAKVTMAVATANSDFSTGAKSVQTAINLWGIAKGIAQVAEVAEPALTPVLSVAIAAADPVVAKAQVALNDATTDVATLQALATTITQQANAITATAAPVIKVVPSAAP